MCKNRDKADRQEEDAEEEEFPEEHVAKKNPSGQVRH